MLPSRDVPRERLTQQGCTQGEVNPADVTQEVLPSRCYPRGVTQQVYQEGYTQQVYQEGYTQQVYTQRCYPAGVYPEVLPSRCTRRREEGRQHRCGKRREEGRQHRCGRREAVYRRWGRGTRTVVSCTPPVHHPGYTSRAHLLLLGPASTDSMRQWRDDDALGSDLRPGLGSGTLTPLFSSSLFTFLSLIRSSFPSLPRVRNERSDDTRATRLQAAYGTIRCADPTSIRCSLSAIPNITVL